MLLDSIPSDLSCFQYLIVPDIWSVRCPAPSNQIAAFSSRFQFPVKCRMRCSRRPTLFASRPRRYCSLSSPNICKLSQIWRRHLLVSRNSSRGDTAPQLSAAKWSSPARAVVTGAILEHATSSDFRRGIHFWSSRSTFGRSSRCSRAVVTWRG